MEKTNEFNKNRTFFLFFFLIFFLFQKEYQIFSKSIPTVLPTVPKKKSSLRFRIVSWNLYNRLPNKKERIERAMDFLSQFSADIIFLQEVGGGWFVGSDSFEKAMEAFPKEKGWFSQVDWFEKNLGIYRNGLLTLSRFPIEKVEYRESKEGHVLDWKGFQILTLKIGGEAVRFFHVHLRSTEDEDVKKRELDQIQREITKKEGNHGQSPTTIVLGDYNWNGLDPVLQTFQKIGRAESLADWLFSGQRKEIEKNWVTWNPSYEEKCNQKVQGKTSLSLHQGIDHILLWGGKEGRKRWKFSGGGIQVFLKTPHPSDHCPIFADLEWSGSS